MGYSIPSIRINGTNYPLIQVSDPSVLIAANSNNMEQISQTSGHNIPTGLESLGQDFLEISTWINSGEPDVYKDFENCDASMRQQYYVMSGGYNANRWDIMSSDYQNILCSLLGSISINNLDLYFGIYIVDDYAYGVRVLHNSNNTTQFNSNGGNNAQGRLIYNAFMGAIIQNGGGAGSGYIGNSLLSNKKMVGYNVPTSSAEGTKTESTNEASATPVSGKPKIGNGFVRITLKSLS